MLTTEQKKEIAEFFAALGIIAGTAGAVYRDKKIDAMDFAHVMALLGNIDDVVDGFDDLDVVFEGMKSMSIDEIIETLRDAVMVGKSYETSRKS